MKLLFAGGGTLGSVTSLLAVVEELKDKNPDVDFYWLGTKAGPEESVIREYNIEFKAVASGKLRRYFSLLNFMDVFKIALGFFQSFILILKCRPDVIVSAGGYVAVPVVWAGWLLGIPSLIHQQDVRAGLANKLCAGAAKIITVCFPESVKNFKQSKVQITGNPVRQEIRNPKSKIQDLIDKYKLNEQLPRVLVMGGGRGARSINKLVEDSIKELVKFCQIVHVTGIMNYESKITNYGNYYKYDFLVDSTEVLQLADLIVSRAGMGALTEIAYLGKPAIIMPIPNSHQVDNALYFYERGAVEILDQKELAGEEFVKRVRDLLGDKKKMKGLGDKAQRVIKWGAEEKIAGLILSLAK
ncbi:undecaprenyldiphospho-muramoylpentapeptide beta-N-acetylglucosaminyltransferase [Candidatus Kuenenbacteria bacterium CG_4_9_14_3_um_filter_39_14]|uniref:UDP-N-acetylglucosamine--N-acetylmuramyl-(pentapeptide) pyrophosphoryl-undecaprenol N-acetylglucosamine transferase n=6 Tax=Candidatus Kueneniibacteriota TaxID=1752740 RepID=A0A2M7MHR9_9BACT|nr:undecaprenyldiphospho-muramoylpentapeptide beta-N-acetylglucosaminyltransferase [Candidatus Kuenenbacteria bacterium]OIP55864.1 MAG: undecaprenyldiphospho-muramoylpentapeptide beta-N-acetylglucosaminyltransferase [Candidatus Kuenenbacteria bacterium CG2_30_39_24]PIP28686.1 MAG: undecaprenyldiphospho-muramoylpentapeptide beta-N-acetylglucosaminyltransferase [Candidatus Kuenenbacteria bacterium CG23_combo_of_CG06-09_8_20_14_all_39_39]PIP75460.1 MAG: undecaprenyldiphospho-muramoylpentapeptide be